MLKRLLLCVVLLLPGLLLAAEPVRVVFHLNEAEKLPLLVNNATNLKQDLGKGVVIEVVVNGPAITRLASFANSGEQLQKLLDAGIEVGGCSNALRTNKIDPAKLYPGIGIIEPGAITRLVKLQQQGYIYIKI